MLYKRIIIWLCVIMLCLSACSTTTLSVTMENDDQSLSLTIQIVGTTWADLVWQLEGTTYTAVDSPTVTEPVVHLQAVDGSHITVYLPHDGVEAVQLTMPAEDGTEQVYSASATKFQKLLDWAGTN